MQAGRTPRQEAVEPAVETFVAALDASLADGSFVRLTLGCWRGAETDLQRVTARVVDIKGSRRLNVTAHHKTRDLTNNVSFVEGADTVRKWLLNGFRAARLFATTEDIHLDWNKRTGFRVVRSAPSTKSAVQTGHDRAKRRLIPVSAPFLRELGVTSGDGRVFPSMSHKWKQISKFVEILDHAVADSPLADRERIVAADFGSGKGYLTFAVHHHLRNTLGRDVGVTGIERRDDLVAFCNGVVAKLGLAGLRFATGDLRTHDVRSVDLLIALHACDTATDEAIALGIRSGAAAILCAPCCHKEIRPQLNPPEVLRPLLHFGVHAAQEAEMLTDCLRALLMESRGYRTQVFEFVSTEHTDKNKMILGIRAPRPTDTELIAGQIAAIKGFYGIREQRLEALLRQCSAGTCVPS